MQVPQGVMVWDIVTEGEEIRAPEVASHGHHLRILQQSSQVECSSVVLQEEENARTNEQMGAIEFPDYAEELAEEIN